MLGEVSPSRPGIAGPGRVTRGITEDELAKALAKEIKLTDRPFASLVDEAPDAILEQSSPDPTEAVPNPVDDLLD